MGVRPLGTAVVLAVARSLYSSDLVLALNGDSYCQADPLAFWRWHRKQQAEASVLLAQMHPTSRYGKVLLDDEGRVTCFEEKGEFNRPRMDQRRHLFARPVLPGRDSCRTRSLAGVRDFSRLVGRGLYGYPGGTRFLDIGTPESYAQAEQFF